MKEPTFVYKFDGEMDSKIIDSCDLEQALSDGWRCSPGEAEELFQADPEGDDDSTKVDPINREELETQANELGIKFRSDISDEKLQARINQALEA